MKNKIAVFSVATLILDFLLLLILGKQYSKFSIYNNIINLHSIILLVAAITSFVYFKKSKIKIISIEILFLIAILYFSISLFKINFNMLQKGQYSIRQFMLFGYAILIYTIVKHLFSIKKIEKMLLKFIRYFGFFTIIMQIIYIIYFLIIKGHHPFFARNYYSPIVIMGLFIFESYTLVTIKNKYSKHLLFLFTFIISLSTGHDSAFLAILVIYISYLFLLSSAKIKMVLAATLVIGIVFLLLYVPSYSDANMQWRIIYWKDVLNRLINNYFIFGEGFGNPYASKETFKTLNNLMISYGHSVTVSGDNIYKVAPHNSFLTMVVHIGVFAIILLVYPLIHLIKNRLLVQNKEIQFLLLSLIGMSVFSFFNVVLELPHSSSIFWLTYFILAFKIKQFQA